MLAPVVLDEVEIDSEDWNFEGDRFVCTGPRKIYDRLENQLVSRIPEGFTGSVFWLAQEAERSCTKRGREGSALDSATPDCKRRRLGSQSEAKAEAEAVEKADYSQPVRAATAKEEEASAAEADHDSEAEVNADYSPVQTSEEAAEAFLQNIHRNL